MCYTVNAQDLQTWFFKTSEMYLGPSQAFVMEFFCENSFWPQTIQIEITRNVTYSGQRFRKQGRGSE